MVEIRALQAADVADIETAFIRQGWPPRTAVLAQYLREQGQGVRRVLVAVVKGEVAGYLTVLSVAKAGPFAGKLPEITDFNVFEPFRRCGVGSALMAAAEAAAGLPVSLGVGVHAEYGPAQRLYARRGYLPDGSGAWLNNEPVAVGTMASVDDLILYLCKDR